MARLDYLRSLRKKKKIINNGRGLKYQLQSHFSSSRGKSLSFSNKIHDGDIQSILMFHKHAEVNIM